MRGLPHFCISIALAYRGKIEHGVIYDPIRQELFTASKGRGAQYNDQKCRVSRQSSLSKSLIATGFPYQVREEDATIYGKLSEQVLLNAGDLRRAGSAALDLAYVACGRLDGYYEYPVNIWDIAAGALMVKEAGGLVCDLNGGENHLSTGGIIASNPKIFKPLMKTAGPIFPDRWKR